MLPYITGDIMACIKYIYIGGSQDLKVGVEGREEVFLHHQTDQTTKKSGQLGNINALVQYFLFWNG